MRLTMQPYATILEPHEVTLIDPKPAKIQETAFLVRQCAATICQLDPYWILTVTWDHETQLFVKCFCLSYLVLS